VIKNQIKCQVSIKGQFRGEKHSQNVSFIWA